MSRRKRVERLEEQREAWEAAHLPLSHVSAFLFDVLTVVQEEAGKETCGRVAGRIVGAKLRRIEGLRAGRA